jgi:hypothetical protein
MNIYIYTDVSELCAINDRGDSGFPVKKVQ